MSATVDPGDEGVDVGFVDEPMVSRSRVREATQAWSRHVRVHHAEFLSGTLSNGISVNALMDELHERSFASTLRNENRRV